MPDIPQDPSTIDDFRQFIIREVKKHRPELTDVAEELATKAVTTVGTADRIPVYMHAYRREVGHRKCE